jgi:hypothetical protein
MRHSDEIEQTALFAQNTGNSRERIAGSSCEGEKQAAQQAGVLMQLMVARAQCEHAVSVTQCEGDDCDG